MLPDGQRIRSLRMARGWTQDRLAEASHTTTRTIQRVEADKGAAMETLRGIASALKVNFGEILFAPKASCPDLAARREEVDAQLRKHYEIRKQLDEERKSLGEYWKSLARGLSLTEADEKSLDKWHGNFSICEILNAMDVCARQYLSFESDGLCSAESAALAFNKIPGVCRVTQLARSNPQELDLYLLRGFIRNRIPGYFNIHLAMQLLKKAVATGVDLDSLRKFGAGVRNWTEFRSGLEEIAANPALMQEKKHPPPAPDLMREIGTNRRMVADGPLIVSSPCLKSRNI